MSKSKLPEHERFLRFVEKTTTCWLWRGGKRENGYGIFYYKGRSLSAHKSSYLMAKGAIATGLQVCHTCDVRACVNPDHLFLGTPQENHADMIRKGRRSKTRKSKAAERRREGYCTKGHVLTPGSFFINGKMRVVCRQCNAANAKAWRQKRTQPFNAIA